MLGQYMKQIHKSANDLELPLNNNNHSQQMKKLGSIEQHQEPKSITNQSVNDSNGDNFLISP